MDSSRVIRKSLTKNNSFNNGRSIKNDTRYENLTKQMLDLQCQLAEYDVDFNELKESNEFLTNERLILEESLSEAENKIKNLVSEKESLEKIIENFNKNSDNELSLNSKTIHFNKIELENLTRDLELTKQEINNYKLSFKTKDELIKQKSEIIVDKDKELENLKTQLDDNKLKLLNSEVEYEKKINQLKSENEEKDIQYKALVAKYYKHRKIWQENEERANFEVKKLDEIIDNVISTLKNKIEFVRQVPEIKLLLDQLTTEQS